MINTQRQTLFNFLNSHAHEFNACGAIVTYDALRDEASIVYPQRPMDKILHPSTDNRFKITLTKYNFPHRNLTPVYDEHYNVKYWIDDSKYEIESILKKLLEAE